MADKRLQKVIDGTHHGLQRGMDAVLNAKDGARKQVRSTLRSTRSTIKEQPIKSVLIAAAVGAGVALLAKALLDSTNSPFNKG